VSEQRDITFIPYAEKQTYFYFHVIYFFFLIMSSILTYSGYGLDDRMIEGSIPGGDWEFFFSPLVQTDCGAHPASYTVGTVGCFAGGKAVGA
jgi:hypothetical protein